MLLSVATRLLSLWPEQLKQIAEKQMALQGALGRLSDALMTKKITTNMMRLPPASVQGSDRDIAITFEGVTADEARTLIDCAIKIEQARTGDVLTPTEYRNRFSGLDLDGPR